ncbi:hypothetical protein ACEZDB_27415 [Streptacidiphilus sp. N1-3]|uniref:Uncharacterized protein n=1 Tax=Streptacidiphilus alkalitolerans TaxID=3342712 RepID=A0ABV6X7W7_9ACTN
MRAAAMGTWVCVVFWAQDHILLGFGVESLAADLIEGLLLLPVGLSVWEHFHPRPKRRRSWEREAEQA